MKIATALPSALFCLALSACQSAPTRETPAPTAAPAPAASTKAAQPRANDMLNAVAWMQTSVEYRLLAGQVYRAALTQLDRALKTPDWDALVPQERGNPATGLPPAVIVDIDETVLDNSPYQVRLMKANAQYDEFTWAQWVKEEAARPIPGALEFAQAAEARGVTVFYISNRAADLNEATFDNLRKAGFPISHPGQFLGLGTVVDGCEEIGTEKGCRRRLVGQTHRVLMQFGDQIGDMQSILVNTSKGREDAMAPYLGWVGERWFILPNPAYGSWLPALFNNAWEQPEGERRQQILDGLRD